MNIQEAADFLNTSTEYVEVLIRDKVIKVLDGDHIDEHYLCAYKEEIDKRRRQTLTELTQWAQDNGFYD